MYNIMNIKEFINICVYFKVVSTSSHYRCSQNVCYNSFSAYPNVQKHTCTLYVQYTKRTVHPPHRPIFNCIKLNWVRWPDSDSVRTQRKSCTMKTSPKKAESAPVLLILEQLWAGRMWKGQKRSRILHMNLRTR